MKPISFFCKTAGTILLTVIIISSWYKKSIKINDEKGVLLEMNVPVRIDVELNKKQLIAAREGRLSLLVPSSKESIPVQLEKNDDNKRSSVVLIMPNGFSDNKKYKLIVNKTSIDEGLTTLADPITGQLVVQEGDKAVLQYNYQTVYEKDVIRPESEKGVEMVFSNMSGVYYDEYLKANPNLTKNDTTKSSIYAVSRSDYIHPLYGLNGEMLTSDWPDGGHPRHRGIFWAWPEVEYGTQRGDIYALQRVFARPTGKIEFTSGAVYAQIDAENLWMWEDSEPIVNEQAIIRVYHSTSDKRIIDLTIKLLALKDSVTIATRFTNSYGGLNIRMQTPGNQEISYFTDEKGSNSLRAWSDFTGIFEGNKSESGLIVLQHKSNPEYPGEWREYPDLAWVQPTFPTPDSRYLLSKEVPLVLRFRMIIHSGGKQNEDYYMENWDAYNSNLAPL